MYTKDPTSYAYAYMQLEMEDRSIFTLKLIVMEHFCRFAHIPRSVLTGFVPDYIYDAITTD